MASSSIPFPAGYRRIEEPSGQCPQRQGRGTRAGRIGYKRLMRRRTALALPLALALPRPAWPQPVLPGGAETMRSAGRQAIAFAAAQRWAEADAAAQSADPLIRKLVGWMRLQSRDAAAGAAEIVGFALANPAWPGQLALGRRAEEMLASDPDDGLAFAYFAAHAPQGLEGYQRLADALARTGRTEQAARVIRTGWEEAPADPAAEPGFLERNIVLLTPEHHWRRFDRLALARQTAAAGRVVAYLDPVRQSVATARLAYAADRADADAPTLATAALGSSAMGDPGLTFERARWLRRRDRDGEAVTAWAEGPAAPPETAVATWPERQIMGRKLLRLGDARAAYGVIAGHGITGLSGARQDAEFLAGFIALRRLEEPAAAERHFIALAEGSRSVITRARALYWQGRALAARGDAATARRRYAAAAELPLAFYGQLAALALGEDGAALSARIRRAPAPPIDGREEAAFAAKELARVVLALADIGETRRARQFLLRLEDLAPDAREKAMAARLGTRIGRPDHAVWVVRGRAPMG